MSIATYTCTALAGINKAGILKPDEDGYYDLVLGALDFHNASGAFYPLAPAKKQFEESSSLMRRVKKGVLVGECGHPRKLPGMSMHDFIARILDIDEKNISHHIREVRLEYNKVKDDAGRSVVAIMGKVRPTGPQGEALRDALNNKHHNVAFSIRSLTDDVITQTSHTKNIRSIVTWDWVTEGGISVAQKYHAPALESFSIDLNRLADEIEKSPYAVGMESGKVDLRQILEDFDYKRKPSMESRLNGRDVPSWAKW